MAGSTTTAPQLDGPLRVAVVGLARFGIAEPFAGGMESHTAGLAHGLRSAGHHVEVFAGSRSASAPPGLEVRPVLEHNPTEASGRMDTAMPPERILAEHAGYATTLATIAARRFDIVHNTSLHYLPPTLELDTGLPMIHAVHTPPFPWLEDAHRARAVRDADRVVAAVSAPLAAAWGELATHVVPNGVDTGRWTPRRAVRIDHHALWVGRIVAEKGPHLAIDAARAAGWTITLAGPVHDPIYFDTEIRPRLGGAARYCGHLDAEELRFHCSTAQVGMVTPRWDEPFGLVVAEMLSCGLPVVGFARGALPELVEPSVGILVPPDDVDALAAALPDAATIDRDVCRKYAESNLSAQAMVDAYVGLYRTRLRRR